MKTRRTAALLLLAFVPQLVALPAVAQQDDPITVQARARFKEGVDFYDKGQFENARLAFLQAYALKKHPAVLLNLAQSSAKSGHALEAANYFKQYLRESTTATPEQRRDAESGLAEARQKIGRIEVVAPAGTEVSLDDKEKLGTAPFSEPFDVEPGPHTLKSSTETVRVTPNVGQKVQAKFGGGAAAAPPVVAPVPTPTAAPAETPPASTAPASDATPPTAEPPHDKAQKPSLLSPPESMGLVWGGLVIGVAGAAGAIIFAIFKSDAQSKSDSVANQIRSAAGSPAAAQGICTRTDPATVGRFGSACSTLKDDNDKVDTNATIANVSLVVMGVGFATAAGWYLFGPKKESSSGQVRVVPYGGWGNAGVNLGGSF
jgi:hypothetical protein